MAALASASRILSQSGNWVTFFNRTLRGLLATAQHTLMLFGLGSIALIGLLYLKPESLNRLQAGIMRISQANAATTPALPAIGAMTPAADNDATTPAAQALTQNGSTTPAANSGTSTTNATSATNGTSTSPAKPLMLSENLRQQRWVANWLSRRYRVAGAATEQLVTTAYQTAHEIQIDPLLILAVVAIESGFNPIAESPMGAQGLMQVMSKVHHDKFQSVGGIKEALNPVANIKVGALILKDYVTRGGSMEAGLKTYVGAAAFENDTGYGSKVIAEYQRLKLVARGKTVPLNTATAPTSPTAQPGSSILPVARDATPLPDKAVEKDRVAAL
jgi:soluble lytic murein transglycosylase-like protein